MSRFFLTFGLIAMAIAEGYCQDLKKVMKEMKQQYSESTSLDLVMQLTVLASEHAAEQDYNQLINIKKTANNYWYKFDYLEMLMSDQSIIMIDKQSKLINYSKRKASSEKAFYSDVKFDIDSIFALYENPEFVGVEDNVSHYIVKEKTGPIEKIHFYIASSPLSLKKIQYNYREGQFVTIEFLVFESNPSFDEETFSESRYVQQLDGKLAPSRYYKNYTVHLSGKL